MVRVNTTLGKIFSRKARKEDAKFAKVKIPRAVQSTSIATKDTEARRLTEVSDVYKKLFSANSVDSLRPLR